MFPLALRDAGLTCVVAGVLGLAALAGPLVLAAGVFAAQLVLVWAWVRPVEPPVRPVATGLAAACCLAADVVAVVVDGPPFAPIAGVLGVTFVVGLLTQLLRRHGRPGATIALAASVSAAVLATGAVALVALRDAGPGTGPVATALAAAALPVLAGALAAVVSTAAVAVAGALVVAAAVGVLATAGPGLDAALFGLGVGAAALVGAGAARAASAPADWSADRSADRPADRVPEAPGERRPGPSRGAAVGSPSGLMRPALAAVLPIAVAAPAAYPLARLLS